jgi:hypothetical protein
MRCGTCGQCRFVIPRNPAGTTAVITWPLYFAVRGRATISVLAKVDRRLVNTCLKLPDVFTRIDVCEKYQEGLKETAEV